MDEAATEAARRELRARPGAERTGAGTDLGPVAIREGEDLASARAPGSRDGRQGAVAHSSAAIGRRARAAAAGSGREAPSGYAAGANGGGSAAGGIASTRDAQRTTAAVSSRAPAPSATAARTANAAAGANGANGISGNDTALALSARYGEGWSFEIVGYHLGDDEVEVTGQLRANGSSVQRTARGNGREISLGDRLKRASDTCLRDCAAALEARP